MFSQRIKTHHSAMMEGKKYLIGPRKAVEILNQPNESPDHRSTIYIHVPFCSKICSFCNMRRSLQKPDSQYGDYLVKEIEAYASLPYVKTSVFDAVYFGGGTPTTLATEELIKIMTALKKNFVFTENAEFTIETTVTQLSDEKLDALIKAGVNRFSVGVQTFDKEGRKLMNRIGSGEAAYQKLATLKQYEGVTVSMDLIYNYPGQTMESLMQDLDTIKSLELDGFSMYSLIDMKETKIDKAQAEENDEKMFFTISKTMEQAGYHFLELTKMVKEDDYKYIMNRHQGADTLPLGAGAGGSMNGLACMNPIILKDYQQSVDEFTNRQGMLFDERYKEVTRFKGAIQTTYLPHNTEMYQKMETYQEFVKELEKHDMIVQRGDRYQFTTKGIFWGNTISRELSMMLK